MTGVLEHLIERGDPFLVLPDPRSARPERTARLHGIEPTELLRSEVVAASGRLVMLVVPWPRALDLTLAQRALGDPAARPATDAEVRAAAPGIEPAAVPPLATLLDATMVVDPAVLRRAQVAFPAGSAGVVVVMEGADLFRGQIDDVAPLTVESLAPEPAIAASRRAILEQDDLLPVHMTAGRAVPVA